ncbi:tetratricopeptide repeat protein [Streptomyces lasalocidi]
MAWYEREHQNLLAAVERAATAVPDTDLAWRLATTLFSYLFVRCQWQAGRRVHELGLATALGAGDGAAEAWVRNNLGIFLTALGRPGEAAPQLTRALEVRRELGDVSGEAATLSNLTRVFFESGQLDTALAYALQALATAQRAADRKRESSALNTVAICLHEPGSASGVPRLPEAEAGDAPRGRGPVRPGARPAQHRRTSRGPGAARTGPGRPAGSPGRGARCRRPARGGRSAVRHRQVPARHRGTRRGPPAPLGRAAALRGAGGAGTRRSTRAARAARRGVRERTGNRLTVVALPRTVRG